ncbi:hypothetical protein [Paraferrimonas sp. SM1919]|uniref:hypothetical protein n=1 Tax=Paraferrimonas sp. SM1919 TaxID=2662263 RepID=UPI0013D82E01|nr:hypothetical protein [Paraferrimonas sp. SM1919]
MKYSALAFSCLLIAGTAVAHDTSFEDDNCHWSPQEGEHCHYKVPEISAMDVSLGYQFELEKSSLVPFVGVSYAKKWHQDSEFGGIVGLRHQDGMYASYVSTTKTLQIGISIAHLSFNHESIGLGMSVPLTFFSNKQNSSSPFVNLSLLSQNFKEEIVYR